MTGSRKCGRDLKEQRGFADTGVAAKEQHRPAHQPTAGDSIEFGDAGGKARRLLSRPLQGFDRKGAALAHLPSWSPRTFGAFLDQRVPFAAGLAFARPARGSGPAILANKILRTRRHLSAPVTQMAAQAKPGEDLVADCARVCGDLVET